jgi:hypothetical protein
MKILGIKLEDRSHLLGWHASLLLDEDPLHVGDDWWYRHGPIFETRVVEDGIFYYAELDGMVSYFFSDPKRKTGYGGAWHFPWVKGESQSREVKGPWSSRAEVANELGFGPVVDISYTVDPQVLIRGYTWFSGAVTVEKFREGVAEHLNRGIAGWEEWDVSSDGSLVHLVCGNRGKVEGTEDVCTCHLRWCRKETRTCQFPWSG